MKMIIILMLFFSFSLNGQSAEVIAKLKMIESGKIEEVVKWFNKINVEKYEDESIKIIDALLTLDADKAVKKYDDFQKNYPKNDLASLSLFRIYSYYYSLGMYSKANEYAVQLRNRFPNSPYNRNINSINLKDEKFVSLKITKDNKITDDNADSEIQREIYYIQVGAFSNINNAKQLQRKLLAKKYKAVLTKKNVNGVDLNVVTIENFKSLDDAEKTLSKINNEFKVNCKIFKVIK